MRDASGCWYNADEGCVHDAVEAHVHRLETDRQERCQEYEFYRLVFEDCPAQLGALNTEAYDTLGDEEYVGEITVNLIRAAVTTVHSKMSKNQPLPTALTKRGDWNLHVKARQLAQFCEGDFEAAKVFDVTADQTLDALLYGTGIAKSFDAGDDEGTVTTERIYAGDLWIDPVEAASGKPRQIGQRCLYDVEHLVELFPDHEDDIRGSEPAAPSEAFDESTTEGDTADLREVREFWFEPRGKSKGRHVICLKSCTLLDEEWTRKLPFDFLRWMKAPGSFWGKGMVADLLAAQAELNSLSQYIQEGHYHGNNFLWWIDNSSEIEAEKIGNIPGLVVRGNSRPEKLVGPSLHPEIYQERDQQASRIFQLAGVSELAASAMKPAGLDSGKALRVYADLGSERFAWFAGQYERNHLGIAEQRIECARASQERRKVKPKKVFAGTRAWVDEIDFPDLKADQYRMRVTPVSKLSSDFAGQLADIQELINVGVISDPVDIRRLLQLPDLAADNDLQTAHRDVLDWAICRIIYDGKPMVCEPEWDAANAKKLAGMYLAMITPYDPPTERKSLLRNFMLSCDAILQKAMAAAAPPPPGPGAPGAMPPVPPEAMPPGMPPDAGAMPPPGMVN